MKIFKLVIPIIFLMFGFKLAQAKDLSVSEFYEITEDLTARTSPVLDLADNACALIKVTLPDKAAFEGNIVKNEYKTNEYYIYVSPGTLRLVIKYPGTETLTVNFSDFLKSDDNKGLKGARTYRLKLEGVPEETSQLTEISSLSLDYQNSGTLILHVEPKDADILINGLPQSLNSYGVLSINLPLGQHSFRVYANRYYSSEGSIKLNKKNVKLEKVISLKPKFGFLTINADSELDGAAVTVDNKYFGTLPIKSSPIDNGSHEIKITHRFYQPYSQTIHVTDSSSVNISPTFASNSGSVEIIIDDKNAELYDNGERLYLNNGKWKGKLEPGTHNLELKKSYYHPLTKNIKVDVNQTQTVRFDKLVAMNGSMQISVSPPEAEIYINGKKVGNHKYTAKNLNPGSYTLEVRYPGFETQKENIHILDRQPLNKNIYLKRSSTSCKIDGSSGGYVYIDGVYKGTVPYTIYGYVGEKHKVKIVWPYTHLAKTKKTKITLGKDFNYYGVLENHRNRGRQVANIIWTCLIPSLGWMSWFMNPVDE